MTSRIAICKAIDYNEWRRGYMWTIISIYVLSCRLVLIKDDR